MKRKTRSSPATIKAVRKAVALAGNQVKLAALVGCAQQTISDIIHGRRPLSAENAVKISSVTGVPREQLRPDIFGDAA